VKARGHELHVDDTTLAQMLACGAGKATVGFGGPGRSRPNAMKDDLFHTKGELRSSPNAKPLSCHLYAANGSRLNAIEEFLIHTYPSTMNKRLPRVAESLQIQHGGS
jgi:hypothetical protein